MYIILNEVFGVFRRAGVGAESLAEQKQQLSLTGTGYCLLFLGSVTSFVGWRLRMTSQQHHSRLVVTILPRHNFRLGRYLR